MGILEWVVAGLIVGVIARLLVPGRHPIGCIGTVLLGVLGIYLGNRLWREFVGRDKGVAWIGSVIVAVLLLLIWRNFTQRRRYY